MVGKKKKAISAKAAMKASAKLAAKAAGGAAPSAKKRSSRRDKGEEGGPLSDEARSARRIFHEHRRAEKLAHRRQEDRLVTGHLVGRIEAPKTKYPTQFALFQNPDKKERQLEFQRTKDKRPPPGFEFIPIGNPTLTTACKEISRERGALFFIVSDKNERTGVGEDSKISDHIWRIGNHFRETIVEEARRMVGETYIPKAHAGAVEPIPESQAEINKQADDAIRDIFPRIPHTDRQMIIEHAFQKGATFHGEPTVGLAPTIPLSRRVQLAVIAHIRHNHTRYDQLLKETSWVNARKVVEPICLEFLVKWRGDEETGRDQMDELLREVIIITDSDSEDEGSDEDEDDSEDDDSSEEEGEISSVSSADSLSRQTSQIPIQQQQPYAAHSNDVSGSDMMGQAPISSRTRGKQGDDRRPKRSFRRYQAAWDEALHRNQNAALTSSSTHGGIHNEEVVMRMPQAVMPTQQYELPRYSLNGSSTAQCRDPLKTHYGHENRQDFPSYFSPTVQDKNSLDQRSPSGMMHRNQVTVRPLTERPMIHQNFLPRFDTPSYVLREQRQPVVVRRSPTKHGLEDMLIPSIETASTSDITRVPPQLNGPSNAYNGPDCIQRSYPPEAIERRRLVPEPRSVIVIDESPPNKRRRGVHEDDYGRFRPIVATEQHQLRRDSQLIPASSIPARQGLFIGMRSSSTDPTGGSRMIPVYDIPDSPEHMRRPQALLGSEQRDSYQVRRTIGSPDRFRDNRDDVFQARRLDDMRLVDRERILRHGEVDNGLRDYSSKPASPRPCFPVSNRISRSHDMASPLVDPGLIHTFSQSRLDPPLSQTRNGLNSLSERFHQNVVRQGHDQFQPTRSFSGFGSPPQNRSPFQHIERPTSPPREQHRQAGFYNHYDPQPERRQIPQYQTREPPAHGENPLPYARAIQPRQIIVLE